MAKVAAVEKLLDDAAENRAPVEHPGNGACCGLVACGERLTRHSDGRGVPPWAVTLRDPIRFSHCHCPTSKRRLLRARRGSRFRVESLRHLLGIEDPAQR